MSELNESIEALEALSAQLIEAETDVKAEETESEGKLSFEFDTAKEAEMMAEKIGCTGSHEGAEGTYIPCATEEQFQAILDAEAEKGLEAEDVEVKEVDRDDAAGTRSMIEGIIDLANSDEEPAKAAAAKMEFDSEEEAVLAAEVLKCSGVHSHSEGKFMPCETHEALVEAVDGFEAPAEPMDENPEKSEDEAELEVKSEEQAEEVAEEEVSEEAAEELVEDEAEVAEEEAEVVEEKTAELAEDEAEVVEDEVEEDAEAAEAADAETAEFVETEEEVVEEKSADDLLEMMEVKTEEEAEEVETEVEIKSDDLAEMMEPAEEVTEEEEISEIAAIEALAVKAAGEGAEVLNSGFSPADDTYVIDVKTADDTIREYFFNGAGEEKGYLVVEAAGASEEFISEEKAAEIAAEYKSGEIVSIEPGLILGTDAFVVEIDEVEGKSYDVFVSLKGEILGHDEYEMLADASHDEEELAEIKALEAELEIKRMYGRQKREELAESGEAMEDGSFPIVDEADLKNAIQAHGRAKDIEAAKKHIVKRAKALGLEALIPAEWGMAPKEEAEEEKGLESAEEIDEKVAVAEVEGVEDTALADAEIEIVATATEATAEEAEAVEALETDDALLAEFADLMRDI